MRTPQLRLHGGRGVYYTRWRDPTRGSRDTFVYFTRDRAESQRLYAEWLRDVWTPALADRRATPRREARLVQVAEMYLSHVLTKRGKDLMVQYRSYLSGFIDVAGEVPASRIIPADLDRYAADLRALGYSQTTVRHYVKAVKRMLRWAMRHQVEPGRTLIPMINLDEVELPRPKRPWPRPAPPGFVARYIDAAAAFDDRLRPWMSVQYLAMCRPSEVTRLINGEGQWIGDGLFALTRSKVMQYTGVERVLVLTPAALAWLEHARPYWKTWKAYTQRARGFELCGHSGSRILRSWAASELRRQGMSREDIKRALGHTTHEPIDHYAAEHWDTLRSWLDRLALPPASASTASPTAPPSASDDGPSGAEPWESDYCPT